MKISLLINVKMPTSVGILIFISSKNETKHLSVSKQEMSACLGVFVFMSS